jgi:LysM repeat protein
VSKFSLLFFVFALIFSACASPGETQTSTAAPTVPLIPFRTATAIRTAIPEQDVESPLASPTPKMYTVVEGDTFFSIAATLGISLDALMAANPSVDARLISPGTELLIPAVSAEGTPISSLPTPTPVPVGLGEPKCYSTAADELWCFLLVTNESDQTNENLAGFVHLLSAEGETLATTEAVAPLNILSPGNAMPLVAYLQDPPDDWITAGGQLLSAYVVPEGDVTYFDAHLQEIDVVISANGLSARVLGEVDTQSAEVIWVLAVAYDKNGEVVGVRRWDSSGENEFSFLVYSLGPKIADVQLLVEARP